MRRRVVRASPGQRAAERLSGGRLRGARGLGRWRDLPAVLRKIAAADQIVFSVPLVAWKRLLLLPLVVLVFACMVRCRVNVFMHEWAALHWLRRLALAPFLLLSRTMIVVSPFIAGQIAGTRWLTGASRKCRLVPNAPTIRRPGEHASPKGCCACAKPPKTATW